MAFSFARFFPRFLIALRRLPWTLLALVFLALSWLWDRLHPLVRAVVDALPLKALKDRIARFIEGLSPHATLAVFLVPLVASEPPKLAAFWLFARGHWAAGAGFMALGEVLRYGLAAFVFTTCREKLLSIGWFRRLHDLALRIHDWARRQTEPLRREIAALAASFRAKLRAARARFGSGGLLRKLVLLWRRARNRVGS